MKKLHIVRFEKDSFTDLKSLAEELTVLKALASRNPTPVTVSDLEKVLNSEVCNLFIQIDEDDVVVGWCMLTVSPFEDKANVGPIAVQKEGEHTGHGTPLIQFAIDYVFDSNPGVSRIDLSNRPQHDYSEWYRKFGFVPRTEAEGDPTTVYRLKRPSQ